MANDYGRRPTGASAVPLTARSAVSAYSAVSGRRPTSAPLGGGAARAGAASAAAAQGRRSFASLAADGGHGGVRASCLTARTAGTANSVKPWGVMSAPKGSWPNWREELTPYIGSSTANYQKFRKPPPDPAQTMEQRVQKALRGSNMSELQEVYRLLCTAEGQRFQIECRLVTKVIQKMQRMVLTDMKKQLDAGNFEDCRMCVQRLDDEPMLATLAKTKEARQLRVLVEIAAVVAEVKERTAPTAAGREKPVDEQEQQLQALRSAIRRVECLGVSFDHISSATKIERELAAKLSALAALRDSESTQDVVVLERCLEEAELTGLADGEVRICRDKLYTMKLRVLIGSGRVENLRALLLDIERNGSSGVPADDVLQAWGVVHHEELCAAMRRTNSLQPLRDAVARARTVGLKGEMAKTLQLAEQRLAEQEDREVREAAVMQNLEPAVRSRDVDRIRLALVEAQARGVTLPMVDQAKKILCEEELREAVRFRLVTRVKVKVTEGIELGIDRNVVEDAMALLDAEDPKAGAWARIREAIHVGDDRRIRMAIEEGQRKGLDETSIDEMQRKYSKVAQVKRLIAEELSDAEGGNMNEEEETLRQLQSSLDDDVEDVEQDDEGEDYEEEEDEEEDDGEEIFTGQSPLEAALSDEDCY